MTCENFIITSLTINYEKTNVEGKSQWISQQLAVTSGKIKSIIF